MAWLSWGQNNQQGATEIDKASSPVYKGKFPSQSLFAKDNEKKEERDKQLWQECKNASDKTIDTIKKKKDAEAMQPAQANQDDTNTLGNVAGLVALGITGCFAYEKFNDREKLLGWARGNEISTQEKQDLLTKLKVGSIPVETREIREALQSKKIQTHYGQTKKMGLINMDSGEDTYRLTDLVADRTGVEKSVRSGAYGLQNNFQKRPFVGNTTTFLFSVTPDKDLGAGSKQDVGMHNKYTDILSTSHSDCSYDAGLLGKRAVTCPDFEA